MEFCNNPFLGVKLCQEDISATSSTETLNDVQDGSTLNQIHGGDENGHETAKFKISYFVLFLYS